MDKVREFTQLREDERVKIEVLLHQGLSYCLIAAELKRSVSTISRECTRNTKRGTLYQAKVAQQHCEQRHSEKPKHRVFTEVMKNFIRDKLTREKLSPELICVEGKKQWKDFISAEWIYQWIWQMKFSMQKRDRCYNYLYECLRQGVRKKSRGRKHCHRGRIAQRVFIDQRPHAGEKRTCPGHMECDIMLGAKRKAGLLVMLDRSTRKTWLRKLKTRQASEVIGKLKSICECSRPLSITFDNDQSFSYHFKLHQRGIKTFFTHPYSSQEKGSVENRIGILRMFFDKNTNFEKISSQQIKKVENLINNRPLKIFKYKTPNQLYEKLATLH
jgi:IS30 family transposase